MPDMDTFTEEEQIVLRRLAGAMICASEELQIPGADDEVIFGHLLERANRVVATLRQGMDDFFGQSGGTAKVAALNDADFNEVIETARQTRHVFLEILTPLVAQSYYSDPRILLSLNKEDRPPFPKGNTLEQGDWSLLDPVKKRNRVFRNC
jgi:hypothetical protein